MPDLTRFAYNYVKEHGGDADKVLADSGGTLEELNQDEHYIPFQVYLEYYENAAVELNEPNLGLILSEEVDIPLIGPIGYAGMASRTLRDSIKVWMRFEKLLLDGCRFEMVEEGDIVRIMQIESRPSHQRYRQRREFVESLFLQFYRKQTGVHIVPRVVRFAHSFDGDTSEHERIFGCEIQFDQPVIETVLDRELLDLPIKSADEDLLKVLWDYCENVLAEHRDTSPDIVAKTERLVVELLPKGSAKAKVVASELAMSERTLARKLANEGVSFNEILDDLRKDLALRYIGQEDLQLIDVAFLLGYANQSAFTNAFKRWTGKTPRQARVAALR